jgi:hypothetical protein
MATGQNLMHQVQLDDLGDLFGLPQSNCPPREATSSPAMRAFTPDIPPKSWEDIKISTKKNDDGSKADIYKSVGGKEGDTTEVTVLLDGTIKYLHKSKDQIPTYSSAYSPVKKITTITNFEGRKPVLTQSYDYKSGKLLGTIEVAPDDSYTHLNLRAWKFHSI